MDATGESEHKFVLPHEAAQAFVDRIRSRLAPLVHDPARPIAWTRTTYLDTDALSYLRSSGSATQRRLRVREYASSARGDIARLTGACFLELKESTGSMRAKVRCAAPPAEIARLMRGEIPGDDVTTRTSRAWLTLMRHIVEERPSPRVTTWYRRESHTAEGGRVRVTVDADIAFAAPATVGHKGDPAAPVDVLEVLDEAIVEVKLNGEKPDWLVEALTALPEERERFSKFRRAMEATAAGTMRKAKGR